MEVWVCGRVPARVHGLVINVNVQCVARDYINVVGCSLNPLGMVEALCGAMEVGFKGYRVEVSCQTPTLLFFMFAITAFLALSWLSRSHTKALLCNSF